MYWIYIPPIIFIAGLVVLVVILGKKSAAIKKRKDFLPEKKEKVRLAGGRMLANAEKLLGFCLEICGSADILCRVSG